MPLLMCPSCFYLQEQTIILRIGFYRNFFYFSQLLQILLQCLIQMMLSKCWLHENYHSLVPSVYMSRCNSFSPFPSRSIALPSSPLIHAFPDLNDFAHSRIPCQKCPFPFRLSATFLTSHFYYFIIQHIISLYIFLTN